MHEEDVSTANVLEHADEEVPFGETERLVRTQRATEVLGDGASELADCRAGEE